MKCRISVVVCLIHPRFDMTDGERGFTWKFSQHTGEGQEEELSG